MKKDDNGFIYQINEENQLIYESIRFEIMDMSLSEAEKELNDLYNKERYLELVQHNKEEQSMDYEPYNKNIYYAGKITSEPYRVRGRGPISNLIGLSRF